MTQSASPSRFSGEAEGRGDPRFGDGERESRRGERESRRGDRDADLDLFGERDRLRRGERDLKENNNIVNCYTYGTFSNGDVEIESNWGVVGEFARVL